MRPYIVALAVLLFNLTVAAAQIAQPVQLRVWCVRFSADGVQIAAVVGDNVNPGRVILWNAETGELKRKLDIEQPRLVRFSDDGKTMAVTAGEKVHLFDVATGKPAGQLVHPKNILMVAFGPSAKLATSCSDGIIRVWDVKEQKEQVKTAEYPGQLKRMAFSTDGNWVAASNDQHVYQWNAATGEETVKFDVPKNFRAGLGFSADSQYLVRCYADDSFEIGRVNDGKKTTGGQFGGGIGFFDFAPACGVVAGSPIFGSQETDLTVRTLSLKPPTPEQSNKIEELIKELDSEQFKKREAAAQALARFGFVAEPILARAMTEAPTAEVRLRVRKAHERLLNLAVRTITAPPGFITSIALSPDGERIVVGYMTGQVHVLRLPDGKLLRTVDAAKQ